MSQSAMYGAVAPDIDDGKPLKHSYVPERFYQQRRDAAVQLHDLCEELALTVDHSFQWLAHRLRTTVGARKLRGLTANKAGVRVDRCRSLVFASHSLLLENNNKHMRVTSVTTPTRGCNS